MTKNKKILISIPFEIYEKVKNFTKSYGVSISKLFSISVIEKIEKIEKEKIKIENEKNKD